MRRQQDVKPQIAFAVEPALEQQDVAARVRGDAQAQRITRMFVQNLDGRHARGEQAQLVVGVALDLGPETFRASDDKAEVPDLRDVDARVVDLVDDAEAHCEPEPCRAQRAADDILRTARPARRDAGRAWRVARRFRGLNQLTSTSAIASRLGPSIITARVSPSRYGPSRIVTASPRNFATQASRSATLRPIWSWNCPRGLTSGSWPWFGYQVSTTSPNSTPARGERNIPSRFSAGQVRSAPRGTLQLASLSAVASKPGRTGAFRCFWYQSSAQNGSSCHICTWLKRSAG